MEVCRLPGSDWQEEGGEVRTFVCYLLVSTGEQGIMGKSAQSPGPGLDKKELSDKKLLPGLGSKCLLVEGPVSDPQNLHKKEEEGNSTW